MDLRLLTWNIYLGADCRPLVQTTRESLPTTVAKLWENVQRMHYPTRARILARVIAREKPEIVILQEAFYCSVDPHAANGGVRAPVTVYDFTQILTQELAALGNFYSIAVKSPGLDIDLDCAAGFTPRFQDSVAILVSQPLSDSLAWTNVRASRFSRNLSVPIGGEPVVLSRSWASLDVMVGAQRVRIVGVHVESKDDVQRAQCDELLADPLEPHAAVVAGDFNADGEKSEIWKTFSKAGFLDAFVLRGTRPGATWGEDYHLQKQAPRFSERLDWILHRGPIETISASVVGGHDDDRRDGLWASDHAGVIAHLRIKADSGSQG